ncbi:MAG: hypothetical protein ACOWWM_01180 [Desulfobacterales bacterium]|jgi:Zn ribbon nucleic-acid-binding protein
MKAVKKDAPSESVVECLQDYALERTRSIECVCPKCGTTHKLKLLWTGRGVPRKFCPICKHYSTSVSDIEPSGIIRACG